MGITIILTNMKESRTRAPVNKQINNNKREPNANELAWRTEREEKRERERMYVAIE